MWEVVQSRRKRIGSVVVVLVVTAVLFLYNWNYEALQNIHTMPQATQKNIYMWVRQRNLARAPLLMIAEQTGVSEEIVASLLEEGKWQKLLELQSAYFLPVCTKSLPSSIVTISEYVIDEQGDYTDGTQFADIQEGDILITKNSRFLGWRNGHVGLVVDAEKGVVLEAIMLGTDTRLCSIDKWTGYPAFQVLRLKNPGNTAKLVAAYAKQELIDVPYQLLAGVKNRIFPIVMTAHKGEAGEGPVLKGTQCAHLVWYAYMQVGIDLDSDGGLLVTPTDIQRSWHLEVVQSYGY